jgi:hypothetical protein
MAPAFELHDEPRLPDVIPPKVAGFAEELRAARQMEKTEEEEEEEEDPPPAGSPVPWMMIGGATAAGVGGLSLVLAGVFGALAALNLGEENKPDAYQSEAVAALGTAKLQTGMAVFLGACGAVLLGTCAALLLVDPLLGE